MNRVQKSVLASLVGVGLFVGQASAAMQAASPFDAFVLFGDSLSDVGNNSLAVGSAPAQVITGNTYLPTYTYGPPPSGTYSNGPVWASQFASAMGLGPLVPSLAGGSDYAYGGARTSASQVPSLVQQTAQFTAKAGATDNSDTLFVVAGGGNNARDTVAALAGVSDPVAIGTAVAQDAGQFAGDVGTIVDQLQAIGARHIIVWNVPNIGITPALGAFGPSAAGFGSAVAGSFNAALAARMQGEGVQIFDLFGLTTALSANPASFGLTNATDACGAPSNAARCGDISADLFWDGIHPTTAGHAIIARQMQTLALAPVPEPSELALLLSGLVAVLGFARRRGA